MRESRKPIRIQRRVRKIGFLGRGMALSIGEESDLIHRIEIRLGEESISTNSDLLERVRVDAATVPCFFGNFFSVRPKAVVYPKSSDDVATVLEICNDEQSPIVIRGAATGGLGGAYSCGGVVLDLTRMDGLEAINKSSDVAIVRSGSRWKSLLETLDNEGYEVYSFPLSGDLSTVGGWLSTGGFGWGSLANGEFRQQVVSIEVAIPAGLLIEASGQGMRYSLRSFSGTEGQMGVITLLRIRIKRKSRDSNPVFALTGKVTSLIAIARGLLDSGLIPASMTIFSQSLCKMIPIDGVESDTLIIGIPDHNAQSLESNLENLINQKDRSVALGKMDLDPKKIMVGNLLLDKGVEMLGEAILAYEAIDRMIRCVIEGLKGERDIFYFIQVLPSNRFLIFMFASTESSQRGMIKRNPRETLKLASYAISTGGLPYGVGVWNTPFCNKILGSDYAALRQVKKETDRLCLVNPGRFFGLKNGWGIPVPGAFLRVLLRFG